MLNDVTGQLNFVPQFLLGAERLLKTGSTVLERIGRLLTTGLEVPEKLLTTGAT